MCEALEARGVAVVRRPAPRLEPMSVRDGERYLDRMPPRDEIRAEWVGADAVVNAAGDPDASSRDDAALIAANGVLPGLIGRRTAEAGITRFVHVSSAVVQGRRPVLDESDNFDAFSPYAKSKVLGEQFARRFGPEQTVCYRPPSVHHESRRVTQLTARIAASPLSTVASPGTQPTPQALAANVGAAIAELALTDRTPPPVVIHPWEGLNCESLLELLGERQPKRIPVALARILVGAGAFAGKLVPAVAANARRIEMVWFGQEQAVSWLSEQGWEPPVGVEGWAGLRERLRGRG